MSNLRSSLRLAIIAACLLLPFAVGCGEIELPGHDDGPTSEEPTLPADDDKDDDASTGDDNGEPEDNPNDDPSNGGGENGGDDDTKGDDNAPEDNVQSGQATLTADGHILVDGRLYLSIIEYSGIKGDEATKAVETAKKYAEGTLKGWRIPTRDDAKALTAVLASETQWYGNSSLALLNHALEASELEEYDLISLYEGNGATPSPIYYLSDGGTTAYTFAAGASQPFTSVKANKKYRLRLVKDK